MKHPALFLLAASPIQPHVTGVEGERAGHTFSSSTSAFAAARSHVINHVAERTDLAWGYLSDLESSSNHTAPGHGTGVTEGRTI